MIGKEDVSVVPCSFICDFSIFCIMLAIAFRWAFIITAMSRDQSLIGFEAVAHVVTMGERVQYFDMAIAIPLRYGVPTVRTRN